MESPLTSSSTSPPHLAHQRPPLVKDPSSQSDNMDHSISQPQSSSPSLSCLSETSSVKFVLSSSCASDLTTQSAETGCSTPPSQSSGSVTLSTFSDISYIQDLLQASPSVDAVTVPSGALANISETRRKTIFVLLDQVRKEHAAKQRAKRLKKSLARRAARCTPAELATQSETRSWRQQIRISADALIKATCMQGEAKRAKETLIFPQAFQTVDICETASVNESTGEVASESEPVIDRQDDGVEVHLDVSSASVFAGQIIVQDHISAMRQALSEHTQDSVLRTMPGRYSYHVDASVSRQDGLTGFAVVNKVSREEDSPWTARGYRIIQAMDQNEAEAWAIFQGLQVVKEKVQDDQANPGQDPCSVAIIYSDSQVAIQRVAKFPRRDAMVAQRIIDLSKELLQLGVEVHLHWVPGHKNVPGNELADLVAKKARLPPETFCSSRGQPANRP